MPTFEFNCETCATTFTQQLPMGTKDLPPCPECNGHQTRKVIRPPMVVFKGAGFYKTDSTASSVTPKKTDAPAATDAKDPPKADIKKTAPSPPPPVKDK